MLAALLARDRRDVGEQQPLRRQHPAQAAADLRTCRVAVGQHDNRRPLGKPTDQRQPLAVPENSEPVGGDDLRIANAEQAQTVVFSLHNDRIRNVQFFHVHSKVTSQKTRESQPPPKGSGRSRTAQSCGAAQNPSETG